MNYKNITDLEQFKKDYDNLTIKEITSKYKLNSKTIWSYVKKLKVNRKVGGKKVYKVNDNYFSKFNDSPNKYYILGLIYTDGNLPSKNKNSFIISNIDLQLLEDVKKEMSFTGKIVMEYHKKFDKYIYKLQITSEQIRKDLESFGLTPNKTFTMKFPDVPSEYLRDFIRGLWDGDGSVSTPLSRQKTKKLLISSFVCANYEFIKILLNHLPVKRKTITKRIRKTILYTVAFRGFDSIRIRNLMYYENCLCMHRKCNLFFSYIPRRSETIISNPN